MPDASTTQLTDFDLMVLVSFEAKAEWEGSKRYTYDNWTWKFENDVLNTRAENYADFMGILRENRAALDAWEAAHQQDACDLINAHHDEVDRRREHACLWAVKRNDGRIFPEESRERAEYTVANPWRDTSFTLMTRDVPGGEWREVGA